MFKFNNWVIILQPQNRRKIILEKLKKDGKVDIEQLIDELKVSAMTIRRDLTFLEEEEKVIRTHGGAILNKSLIGETAFHAKEGKNNLQKRIIARKAMDFIQDGSTILLDSGTTTLEIAKLLKERKDVTVITNDILIAYELMESEIKVIVTGGELQNNIGTLFGSLTEQILKNIHVNLFFLGTHAVHLEDGVTAPTFEKASVKKLMIEASEKIWLVTDSSKFDQRSFARVCDLSAIDGIITDDGLPDPFKQELTKLTQVIIADRW